MKLRSHLVVLALASLLPVVAFSAVMVLLFAREEQAAVERGMRETVRAIALTVDTEIDSTITTLQALATAPALRTDRIDDFKEQAARVLATRPDWATVILADASGLRRFNLADAEPVLSHSLADRPYFQQVIETGQPAVSDYLVGRTSGEPRIAVAVPVRGDDNAVRHVLVAALTLEALGQMLADQALPEGGALRIVDRQHTTIAHIPGDSALLGLPAGPLATASEGLREGWFRFVSRSGLPLYAAMTTAPATGWRIALTIPPTAVDGALRASVALVIGVGLALLLLAVGISIALSRRITQPLSSLSAAAGAIGREDALPALPASRIAEVRKLSHAIQRAGELLRERGRDRERLDWALRQRAEDLQAANHAKDEFLATVSHELRSPLNAILGWTQLLREGGSGDARTARALEIIERNARHQGQLIDDLLDVSRIVAGRLRLDLRAVELGAILQQTVETVRPAAEARDIHLNLFVSSHIGPVRADPNRLQQVFWNLLSNAIRFTPKGGHIEIRLDQIGSQARLQVIDSGEGIAADILPHIFEPFRQGDSRQSRTHKGLGLGLSIVRHLIDAHGGSVRAESEGEGRGATFTVILPLMALRLPHGTRAGIGAADAPETLAGVSVLVVEDESDARELLTTVLEGWGARVISAGSAAEGLERLRAERPDVLVSDISMPAEDGYSFIRRVRSLPRQAGGETPAVALTAQSRAEDRVGALLAGFQVHVPKPVEPAELLAVLASLAGRAGLLPTAGPGL